jgi:hypothetical protein
MLNVSAKYKEEETSFADIEEKFSQTEKSSVERKRPQKILENFA